MDGVVDVVSGYANGKTDKTDYEHIGQTDHAETVHISYDSFQSFLQGSAALLPPGGGSYKCESSGK